MAAAIWDELDPAGMMPIISHQRPILTTLSQLPADPCGEEQRVLIPNLRGLKHFLRLSGDVPPEALPLLVFRHWLYST